MANPAESFALALQHHQAGQLDQAEQLYRQILQTHPEHAQTHYLLGLVQQATGRIKEALASFQEAVRLQPDYAEAHYDAGLALWKLGRYVEGAAHCRQALLLRPDNAAARFNLGNCLQSQRKAAEAIHEYQQALRLKPDYAAAYCNLGIAFETLGQLDEAIACHEQALRINSNLAQAHQSLGVALMGQGLLEQALARFREALRLRPDLPTAQSSYLWCLNYQPDADPDVVFEEHRRWGRGVVDGGQWTVDSGKLATGHCPLSTVHSSDLDPQRPLRIGYVSPDFRQHALVGYIEPVLAHHVPKEVAVFCYADVANTDAATARLQGLAHVWRWTTGLTDAELAEQIRADQIDILVDLAGHTGNNRLGVFALKPAPVQATWLGYLNTTGLTTVDYRITDEVLDPLPTLPLGQGEGRVEVRDTEALLRLPGGFCCFAAPMDAPDVTELPALRRGYLTFGSPHSLFKLNASVLDLWAAVLTALPTARLLVFRDTLKGTARERLHQELTNRGIAAERIELRSSSSGPDYLKIYQEIDIGLDAFPWSGGVTTCESLWMGVPVLSLRGVRPAGRNTAAILTRVGLSDWAVDSPEEFIRFAVSLAGDLDRLAQLRSELRERMRATVCDAARFTRVLEEAYRMVWRTWCGRQQDSAKSG